MTLIALALLCAAHAEDLPMPAEAPGTTAIDSAVDPIATRYTGQLIALRTLSAGRGALPDENLEPLLRVQQDGRYNPQDVRQDLAMLYRVAHVVQVRVDVEPWPAFDEDGNLVPAVHVDYTIFPPDPVHRLKIAGNAHIDGRELQSAMRLTRESPWFPEDVPRLMASIQSAYIARGWPNANANIVATPRTRPDGTSDGVDVQIDIDEGTANRVRTVKVHTGGAISDLRARWILARHGVRKGRPYTDASLRAAHDALARVVRTRGPAGSGHYTARVSLAVNPEGMAAVFIDGGRQWSIDTGTTGLRAKEVEEQLELADGTRLTRTLDADSTDALNAALQANGRLASNVAVGIAIETGTVRLTVSGDPGPRHTLGEVVFDSPAHVEGAQKSDRIWTKKYLEGAFLEAANRFPKGRVTAETVDQALGAMREFYRAEGYLGATFTRRNLVVRPGKKAHTALVDVTVQVDPGPRAWLRDVVTTGGELDAREMYADLLEKPVDPSAIESRARKLVEQYKNRGYLNADATTGLTVSADGTRADLAVTVTPGNVVYLRAILIRGYSRTQRMVIDREIDLQPGDPITPEALADIRRRLYDLAVFDRVSVEAIGDEDRIKDLLIEVSERKNLYGELGGGIATDQGARVFGRAGHRNLFGIAHTLTLYAQAGFGWLGDGWTFDPTNPTYRATAHYEAPHVPARGESVTGDLLFRAEEQAPSWRLARSGVAAGLSLKLGAFATLRADYRVQWRTLMDIDPGVLVAGDPWLSPLGVSSADDPSPVTPSALRRQSGLDLSLLVDHRDDPFNPTRGGVGSAAFILTDPLLSDFVFLRAEASWTQLVPVGKPAFLFRIRGGAGWVPDGNSVLPIEDRFQGGGGASFRGFALDTLGPANLVSNEDIGYPNTLAPLLDYAERTAAGRWVPTGGDSMAVGTFEFTVPLDVFGLAGWEATRVALFTDVGNVWWASPLVSTTSMQRQGLEGGDPLLRYALGVGLRRATAVGPVQVDLGFNPARIEARGEDWVRLHVSLGSVF